MVKEFGLMLDQLASMSDGDGSLLDHTVILFGSGMSNSNLHNAHNVPTLVVGSPQTGIAGGRHLRMPQGTPLANLQLTLLAKLGVPVDRFGDSTGSLPILSEV
jgi:hypothetical protein